MENSRELQLAIRKLDGSEISISIPPSATLRDLRTAIEKQETVGRFAYGLILEGGLMLDSEETSLSDLGVQDQSVCMMTVCSTRDYSRITAFEKTLQTEKHPQGVLINDQGELLVSSFYGHLQVFDSDYTEIRNARLPDMQPCQMAFSASGDLVVAFAATGRVGVVSLDDLNVKMWIGGEGGSSHSDSMGVAVSGHRVFVSGMTGDAIRVYGLSDGTLLETWDLVDNDGFNEPSGLAIISDSMLAVADRGNDRVRLINLDGTHAADIGQGLLSHPNDVDVDADGNLLVMDTGNECVAVFREDGSLVTRIMPGFFKDHGHTYSYLSINPITGAIAVSNDDEHSVAVLAPLFSVG